jgi:hypothetical protein
MRRIVLLCFIINEINQAFLLLFVLQVCSFYYSYEFLFT